jgi:hypothetical protein
MSAPRLAALALGLAVPSLACNSAPAPSAAQEPAKAEAPTKDGAAAGGGLKGLFGRKDVAWKFDFKDPTPGPRAPVTGAMLVELGLSRVADVTALTDRLGLKCGDTSIRGMMEERRKVERKRIEDAKARGEDAVTAASWLNYKSKREANPQVRYSCPKTDSTALSDRVRPPSNGRILFVFDSAEHPLRHVSYQRTYMAPAGDAALADYQDAVAYYTKVYGPPAKVPSRELPTPAADGTVEIPPTVNFDAEWNYSDLTVKVGLLRYADLITVAERVEVPHGIRPDAPRDGKTAPPPSPTAPPSPAAPAPATPAPSPAPAAPGAPAQPAAAPAPSGSP